MPAVALSRVGARIVEVFTGRFKQVTLTGPAGAITQTNPLRAGQKVIYQVLSITPPPRVTAFDAA